MAYFNFDRLIDKYTVAFTLLKTVGQYDEVGDWTETSEEVEMQGAIIGVSDKKIYQSDGTLTAKDKYLFMNESLDCDYEKSYIKYAGNKFKIEENPNDNYEFTGVHQYTLKWVSVFD